jgi:hypothetical protein
LGFVYSYGLCLGDEQYSEGGSDVVGPCDVRHMTYAKLDKCALPRASRSLSSLVKNHHFYTPSIFIVVRLPCYSILPNYYIIEYYINLESSL